MQARRVVDVAVSEWQKADTRAAASTAAQKREEQRAKDRESCAAAIRKRKAESATNKRAAGWESFIAEDTDHAENRGPTTDTTDKLTARRPPSAVMHGAQRRSTRAPAIQSPVRGDISWKLQDGRGGSARLQPGRNRKEYCRWVRQARAELQQGSSHARGRGHRKTDNTNNAKIKLGSDHTGR